MMRSPANVCRLLMATTDSQTVVLMALLVPTTLSGALGIPVLLVGIKRLTNEVTSSAFPFAHAHVLRC